MITKSKEKLVRDIGILADDISLHLRFGQDASKLIAQLEEAQSKLFQLINTNNKTNPTT